MNRSVTVLAECYGAAPKDDLGRGVLKEKILSDRLIDLAYAGEPNVNKVILFDAWERLPIAQQRAFIDYALPILREAENKAAMATAEREAQLSANIQSDKLCEETA